MVIDLGIEQTKVYTRIVCQKQYEAPLYLHGNSQSLLRCLLNNKDFSPEFKDGGLFFGNRSEENIVLEIEQIISPISNTALEGLYYSNGLLVTQNEPEGFRKIAYSIDRPDNLIKFQVRIEALSSDFPVLLCNGNRIQIGNLSHGKHFVIWEDPHPKPSYLFALVGGKLEKKTKVFTTISNKKVELEIYTEPKNISKTEFALDALARAMAWDEQTFGLEYDLDLYMIVAVSDFNMGAMENKGLNIFNSKLLLAESRTATDDQFEAILGVVAHEYFHNYTGNRVTLRNWFNLTLKEGLTVFRDQWFTEEQTNSVVKRNKDVQFLRNHQFLEDSGPMSHPILPTSYSDMNNFYTTTIYEKGAEVIRMLSLLFGKEGFKKGLRNYLSSYDGMAVTYEEFLKSMETENRPLKNFRNWYHRSGTPTLSVEEKWTREESKFEFKIIDTMGPELDFPLNYILWDRNSGNPLHEEVALFSGKELHRTFLGIKEKPILSLFRQFSAPVKWKETKTWEDWEFLAKQETDGFSRLAAKDNLILEMFQSCLKNDNLDKHALSTISDIYKHAIQTISDFQELDLFLEVPSIGSLASSLDYFNYHKLFEWRSHFLEGLGEKNFLDWEKLISITKYAKNERDSISIGKRKLFITANQLLLSRSKIHSKTIADWFSKAENMTLEISGLRLLVEYETEDREEALAQFYRKWKEDDLVMDMWFSVQTLGNSEKSQRNAEDLVGHSLFQWSNPNKVRALVGNYAKNELFLYSPEGRGIDFLFLCIEKLDPLNPTSSSTLAKHLQLYKNQNPKIKNHIQENISRCLSRNTTSSGLKEILGRLI